MKESVPRQYFGGKLCYGWNWTAWKWVFKKWFISRFTSACGVMPWFESKFNSLRNSVVATAEKEILIFSTYFRGKMEKEKTELRLYKRECILLDQLKEFRGGVVLWNLIPRAAYGLDQGYIMVFLSYHQLALTKYLCSTYFYFLQVFQGTRAEWIHYQLPWWAFAYVASISPSVAVTFGFGDFRLCCTLLCTCK